MTEPPELTAEQNRKRIAQLRSPEVESRGRKVASGGRKPRPKGKAKR